MLSVRSQLETILFVASKPLSILKLAESVGVSIEEAREFLASLVEKYNQVDSGIIILKNNDEYHMVTQPENREVAEKFMKAEVSGELTKPQLETLTVISYCGPLTKAELEQIRGVQCSIILRNLLMRGLIKESQGRLDILPVYEVSMDYMRFLGIQSLEELPDYQQLHTHEYVAARLSETNT
jgi:segregation and condensation protein B